MLKKFLSKLSGTESTPDKNVPVPKAKAKPQKTNKSADPKPKKSANNRNNKPQKAAAPAWQVSQFDVPIVEGKTRFHDFVLADTLMHAIADLGFEYCTPIQAEILPLTMQGFDAIGKAQTGTGKTAAFLITAITDLLNNPVEGERYCGEPRAIIVAPTRELVVQIGKDAVGLCKHSGLNVSTLIGGMDYQKQREEVESRLTDIVVATPGRLIDFMQRGDLHLDLVEVLVLDEADRMLDMGFIPQVRRIVRATPPKTHRQTLLFSATFTPTIMDLASQWTLEPKIVEIEPESVANERVEQIMYSVSDDQKLDVLINILAQDSVESAIVFANRRDQTRDLHAALRRAGVSVGLLSGEVAQNKRTSTLERFREGKLKVLVATDVAGRGIHIDDISHVINFTLPDDPEDYVHRIGRTGRAGKTGISISFVGEEDAFSLGPIESLLGDKMRCILPPDELL